MPGLLIGMSEFEAAAGTACASGHCLDGSAGIPGGWRWPVPAGLPPRVAGQARPGDDTRVKGLAGLARGHSRSLPSLNRRSSPSLAAPVQRRKILRRDQQIPPSRMNDSLKPAGQTAYGILKRYRPSDHHAIRCKIAWPAAPRLEAMRVRGSIRATPPAAIAPISLSSRVRRSIGRATFLAS